MRELELPAGASTVWIEVGVSAAFDFAPSMSIDNSLILVGIEPSPSYHYPASGGSCAARGAHCSLGVEPRFAHRATLLQRACTSGPTRNVTFYIHPSSPCNTLLPIDPKAAGPSSCVSSHPRKLVVQTLTLASLLRNLPSHVRVPLAKLDVQGAEWQCLESAGHQLQRIDNIFVEVADGPVQWYVGALNLTGLDSKLGERSFARQYCEESKVIRGTGMRELNCLYTRHTRPPLFVKTRTKDSKFAGGAAVYATAEEMARFASAPFVGAEALTTSDAGGALDAELHKLGLPFVRPKASGVRPH